MATGVTPANDMQMPMGSIAVELTYMGKKAVGDILNTPFTTFIPLADVNGTCVYTPDVTVDLMELNQFFFGDNKNALLFLLNNGYRSKVDLIYIDPPFATAADFVTRKQTKAYSDTLTGGAYIEFMRERLIILKELLSDNGSIYVHLDANMAFRIKIIMDEIFGTHNCRAFITRKKCSTKNYTKTTYGNISDYILFYSKSEDYIWHRPFEPWEEDSANTLYPFVEERTGRRYKKVPLHAPGIRNGATGREWHGKLPPPGKHWQFRPETLDEMDARGEIAWSSTGNPRRKVYLDQSEGIPVQDIWLGFRDNVNQQQKTTGYPTEKNLDMLKRIIQASSNEGSLVLDCFAGSGTTLAAANELGRHFIGCDNGSESLQAIIKRLTLGADKHGDYVNATVHTAPLIADLEDLDSTQASNTASNKAAFCISTDSEHYAELCEVLKQLNIKCSPWPLTAKNSADTITHSSITA